MRTPLVVGNWKMNKTAEAARALLTELLPGLRAIQKVEKVVCPPFTALMAVSEILKGSDVGLGSQDMHWEASGAYTGEIAPSMVTEFCGYVIIGHSERRAYFGETDVTVNKKVKAALAVGLIPIVCVGETLQENESGKTSEVVTRQVKAGLDGISVEQAATLVVAYEPVWAIGTGRAASGNGANAVIAENIRKPLKDMFGVKVAESVRVLYGGSVTGANAAEFFGQPEIDGALVGGASLKPDILQITQAAAR
jgi:triosephosphate isomerase (TIM)